MIVFADTNVILSGTFFSGPEARLLSLPGPKLVTADICREEALEVCEEKFKEFGTPTKRIALERIERSFLDVDIVPEEEYSEKLNEAKRLVKGENGRKVLAAVLTTNPDFFVSGDKHFKAKRVAGKVPLASTREVLSEIGT